MKRLTCWLLTLLLMLPALALATPSGGSISGTAFLDADANGLMDQGERTLSDVEISLISVSGGAENIVGVYRTQDDGAFSFSGLAQGTYYLKALLPSGFYAAPPAEGGSVLLPASGQSSRSPDFSLQDGQAVHLPVGVIRQPSYITVYAFGDLNGNGGRMSNEPLLRGVLLELLYDTPEKTYVIGSTTTNKDGVGTIRDLTPGTYRLQATLPEPYVIGPLGQKINTFYNTILPSESNVGASAPFTVPFKGSAGLGVGGVETGKAEGSLWKDANMNGQKEAGEGGFAGATIELTHTALGITRTTVSAEDGTYAFANLQEGTYRLKVTLPEGSMFTLPGDSLFSDGYSASAETDISVAIRKTTSIQPVGVMPATSLKAYAFHDQNVNGIKDDGEPLFAGATVMISTNGQQVAQATTDANGEALFPLLRGGTLDIRMTLPDGQVFTVDGGEAGNRFVSDAAASDLTVAYDLAHGTQGNIWAGVTLPAAITGTLYEDINMNSQREAGEEPLSGFAVQAINAVGAVVAETTTDDQGTYTLPMLIPGNYRVRVPLVAPYIFSTSFADSISNRFIEQTPAYGQTDEVTLSPAQTLSGMDGALFRSAVIQGQVLLGDTSDGFAGQRGGLPNVMITLLDEDGSEVSAYTHAITDEAGAFLLKGALPGEYKLAYRLPAGALFSSPYLEENVYTTEVFNLSAGAEMQADTVFAVKTSQVGGKVFVDANDNGMLDSADTPYAGAVLSITMNELGLTQQTTSDAEGAYLFTNLRPGSYTMDIALDDTMLIAFGSTSPATPALTNIATAQLEVAMGEDQVERDIATVASRPLTGRAFFDNDLSRSDTPGDTPYAELEVKLRHTLSKIEFSFTTGADGTFALDKIFPGAYTIVLSLPNGFELYGPAGAVQEGANWTSNITLEAGAGEMPLSLALVEFGSLSGNIWNMGGSMEDVDQLPVSLYRKGESLPLASVTTDTNGAFRFDSLYPGEYTLGVVLKDGYRFARTLDTAVRTSLITSDASPVSGVSGQSNAIVLTMGEHKIQQDVGMGKMGQLGDFAWLDLDGDGMQDRGEPGVPGIVIRLYQHGQLAAETTTDPYGRYLFHELHPGTYTLQATMPPELTATRQQSDFPLVASILPQAEGTTAMAENVLVPSGGRNLNADLGFVLRDGKTMPDSMKNLPQKDWTPYSDVTPTR